MRKAEINPISRRHPARERSNTQDKNQQTRMVSILEDSEASTTRGTALLNGLEIQNN